jgi:hypothetical protein
MEKNIEKSKRSTRWQFLNLIANDKVNFLYLIKVIACSHEDWHKQNLKFRIYNRSQINRCYITYQKLNSFGKHGNYDATNQVYKRIDRHIVLVLRRNSPRRLNLRQIQGRTRSL